MVGGKRVNLELYAYDEACDAQEGLRLLSRLKDVDKVLLSLGPTCSGTAEPIFNTLQKTLDDPNDTGHQFLFFADTASKFGLAKISPWVFRNTVDEPAMYQLIVQYLKERRPELRTVAVAWEPDFAHSASTWNLIIRPTIERNNYHRIVEVVEWGWQSTEFSEQVARLAQVDADIYITLTHEPTTCASFREMAKQHVRPRAMVAISSLAGGTVIVGCPELAEGLIVPTNFAPVTPKAVELEAKAWGRYKAESNLDRSHTAYEIIYLLKELIEKSDNIENTEGSLARDRRKLRDALAGVRSFEGMIGPITINPEDHPTKPREAEKEVFLLQVRDGRWTTLLTPRRDSRLDSPLTPARSNRYAKAVSQPTGWQCPIRRALERGIKTPAAQFLLPKIVNGVPVNTTGVRNKITFEMAPVDELGAGLLPESVRHC